jgi:hypothetical protein
VSGEAAVETRGLHKSYGDVVALRGVDLLIEARRPSRTDAPQLPRSFRPSPVAELAGSTDLGGAHG